MNQVETYINSQYHKSKIKKILTVSNGWWFKFKMRNPLLSLRKGDSTAGIRMDTVNSENIDEYLDNLRDYFENMASGSNTYMIWVCL